MNATEKTFRYSYIFKHLAVLYFIFLLIVSLLSYFARDVVILTVLAVTLGLGMLLLVIYRTFSVRVSERGITQTTLLGTKSLAWGDIRQLSAQGASLRLRGEHISITISPRLYGAVEISQWIEAKRPGLFRSKHVARLVQNNAKTLLILFVGLLLMVLSLLLYFFRGYVFIPGFLGLLFCIYALGSWYFSPRSLTVDNNCMIIRYHNRSVSYYADDVAGIQAGMTEKGQFRSVEITFRDHAILDMSVFQQTPFITYPALKRWHEENATKQTSI